MSIEKIIQADRLHVARIQAQNGPKGIMVEFFPRPEALNAAGVPDGTKLPPLRFAIEEGLARKLADSIVRQLNGENPGEQPGEHLN